MPTNVRDPRTIITPDAFEIDPDLLGTPLAPPWRRFWALMLDLVVILMLTAMFDEIAIFVWGIVALFFIRVAFLGPEEGSRQAASKLLRVLTGCLGLVILSGVGVAWLVLSLARDDETGGIPVPGIEMAGPAEGAGFGAVLDVLGGGLAAAAGLEDAETSEEAEEVALRILESAAELGVDREDLGDVLASLTPEDAPWKDEANGIYARALDRWGEAVGDAPADAPATAVVGEDDPLDEGLDEAALALVADTLAALEARVEELREDLDDEEGRRRRAEEALEEGRSPMVELFRDLWEQLGSAIGLWSIYFTVLLTLWNGRTVGKRIMGLRVVRLDGEPMTWWSAFERAGGYIAGLATGLLGFAQVFWEANRQCIHDKIVGTVVVDTRATRRTGSLNEAWTPDPTTTS